jgi:hypothetical protein
MAGLLLFVSGCVPGVAWLPDSSGFIYTAGKNYQQLVHYDVVNNKRHILVEDTKAPTLWPALRPDGKEIAVGLVGGREGNERSVQIVFYDRAGQELRRSKTHPWFTVPKEKGLTTEGGDKPQLFWSPRGDKILVHAEMHTAMYDIKADKLQPIEKESVLLVFGGSPFRPDGAGFLIIRENGKGDQVPSTFRFVDWNGKETALEAPPLFKDKAALGKEKDVNKLAALLCPAIYQSHWDGDAAHVQWNVDRLRYLTKNGMAVLDNVKPEKASGQLIKQQFQFATSKVQIRTVALPMKGKDETDLPKVRVEVVRADGKVDAVLDEAEMCVLVPSPDRRLVALRCLVDSPRKMDNRDPDERILVINEKGAVTAHLHVSK